MTPPVTMLGGRYRIDGLIGRGGMATVWRATDTVLDREVAVKRLHARLHGDHELEERFKREGRLVANLSHPNLVRLLDQGGEDDEPFLVFELVDGQDLKTILRQHGRMPFERAAAVSGQIARALAVAHRAGVVHRDIKSHNVLVTKEGVAKLTDFGIARIVDSGGDLTRAGIVIGSSDYLSPEQAEGKPLDGRSDIYSLGVVLFEALTGRLPFSGENPVAVATKHVYEDPPDPRTIVPDIPHQLATTCLKAMAKDPRQRFSSGDSFAEALGGGAIEAAAPPEQSDTTSRMKAIKGPRPQRPAAARARWPRVVTGVAVLAAIGGAAALWLPGLLDDATPSANGGVKGGQLQFTATDYDPVGDKAEHASEVGNVTDPDPTTSWSTEAYDVANVGGKAGVGLDLTLNTPTRVTGVVIESTTPGAIVEIRGPGDTFDTRPLIGQATTLVAGRTVIPVKVADAVPDVVVWITQLTTNGSNDDKYRAKFGKVELLGVANSSR